jgi:hypothetical protein
VNDDSSDSETEDGSDNIEDSDTNGTDRLEEEGHAEPTEQLDVEAATAPAEQEKPQLVVRGSRRANFGVPPEAFLPEGCFSADTITEPKTVKEALASPQRVQWRQATDEEIASLKEHGTWELLQKPLGTKCIPCRWVLKIKRAADGSVERFKARLVAKGFRQVKGIDFEGVYAPVSKHATIRALLAVVAQHDIELDQMDVKTAFPYGDLEEEVYMDQMDVKTAFLYGDLEEEVYTDQMDVKTAFLYGDLEEEVYTDQMDVKTAFLYGDLEEEVYTDQMDVKTAFLYGDLEEEVYMDQMDVKTAFLYEEEIYTD